MKQTVTFTENHHFRRLYRVGESKATPYVVVYRKKNRLTYHRLGITASKKIGNAVQRNRARRLMREAYRLLEPELTNGFYDIVLVARKKTVFSKMDQVKTSMEHILLERR